MNENRKCQPLVVVHVEWILPMIWFVMARKLKFMHFCVEWIEVWMQRLWHTPIDRETDMDFSGREIHTFPYEWCWHTYPNYRRQYSVFAVNSSGINSNVRDSQREKKLRRGIRGYIFEHWLKQTETRIQYTHWMRYNEQATSRARITCSTHTTHVLAARVCVAVDKSKISIWIYSDFGWMWHCRSFVRRTHQP